MPRSQVAIFEGHNGNITAVCFHSEGKWLVTGSEDGTIKIWDLRCVFLLAWASHSSEGAFEFRSSSHLHRNYDNEAPGMTISRRLVLVAKTVGETSERCCGASESGGAHKLRPGRTNQAVGLVREYLHARTGACHSLPSVRMILTAPSSRPLGEIHQCGLSASLRTGRASSQEASRYTS